MRHWLLALIAVLLVGCVGGSVPDQTAVLPTTEPADVQETAAMEPEPEFVIWAAHKGELPREQVRAVILRVMEDPELPLERKLIRLSGAARDPDDLRWLEVDLDGDGALEFVYGFPVAEACAPGPTCTNAPPRQG